MTVLSSFLAIFDHDWEIVTTRKAVVDIEGRHQTGTLFKRRAHGKAEYRVPTKEELANEQWWQAVR